MTVFQQQLQYFLETLTRPEGVLGLLGILVVCIAHLFGKSLKWGVMGLILWLSSLAFQINVGETRPIQLAPPLNSIQLNSRPLCLAFMSTLLIPLITSQRGWRRNVVGWGVLALFGFQILLSIRIAMADVSSRGELSIIVFMLIFLSFGLGLGRWLQDWDDARRAMRAIVIAGVIFIIGTAYQLVMNRASILRHNRLAGTTGNAQHAGTLLALAIPPICYFIVRKGQRYITRILLGAAGGVALLMLAWTGSRTAALMVLVGIGMFFRARLGRLLGAGLLIGIFVLGGLQIYTESAATFSDMFIRGDTRSHVWSALLAQFLDNVAFGTMGESFGVGENSYLALAASMGLTGLVPMAVVFFIVIKQLVRLQRVRKSLGENILLADLVTASLGSIAVGAMFEGYLLGTLTFPVLVIYIDLVVLRFLLDAADAAAAPPTAEALAGSEYDSVYGEMPAESDVYAGQT